MKKCMRAVAAALIAAGVWGAVPVSARADFSITPRLSVTYGGVTVTEEVVSDDLPLMSGNDFVSASGEWEINFLEPFNAEEIPATQGLYVLARLDPDTYVAQPGYQTVHAAIPADNGDPESPEVQMVTFGPPHFGQPGVPSGVYELSVHSYPDTKLVCQEEPPYECAEEPYTDQDFLDWYYWTFAVDWDTYEGDEPVTYEPTNSRAVLFEYMAPEFPAGPSLSLSEESGYDLQYGVNPRKGVADKDLLSFKVVYTHPENVAPERVEVVIGTTTFPMSVDSAAENPLMHDGDYSNGEQYIAQSAFPKNHYIYRFEAEVGGEAYPLENPDFSFQTGYSNVAFIPGFQASRLYIPDLLLDDKIWLPFTNNEALELEFNAEGQSVRQDIYTKDVIDEATFAGIGTKDIYKSFIGFMNELVDEGDIEEWMSFPYDWRYDIKDVVRNPIQLKEDTYSMLEEIERLAGTSDSGKVTLIGHSNGGLIGKQIINDFAAEGKDNLIDQLIMVGTPQLGTPKTIASLLHGAQQSILFGFVLDESTARRIGRNLPGAYNLLPSEQYLNTVEDAVVTFEPGENDQAPTQEFINEYGAELTSFEELQRFLQGADGRSEPSETNTSHPIIANSTLLSLADQNHQTLDTWEPPEHIEVFQIAGWGLDTIRTVAYRNKCDSAGNCKLDIGLDGNSLTVEGDGTVVYPSALSTNNSSSYYFDLSKNNFGFKKNQDHASITEADPVQELILQIVTRNFTNLPEFITAEKPDPADATKKLRIRALSPVALSVTDDAGNFTGIVSNSNPESDLILIKEGIPNSYYIEFGEGKYVGLGGNSTYDVKLQGTGTGTFTLEIDEVEAAVVTRTLVFKDIPVNLQTTASLALDPSGEDVDTVLKIDTNGDGTIDSEITPTVNDEEIDDPMLILDELHQYILSLVMPRPGKKLLQLQLKRLEKSIKRERGVLVLNTIKSVEFTLGLYVKLGLLTFDEKAILLRYLEKIDKSLKK